MESLLGGLEFKNRVSDELPFGFVSILKILITLSLIRICMENPMDTCLTRSRPGSFVKDVARSIIYKIRKDLCIAETEYKKQHNKNKSVRKFYVSYQTVSDVISYKNTHFSDLVFRIYPKRKNI